VHRAGFVSERMMRPTQIVSDADSRQGHAGATLKETFAVRSKKQKRTRGETSRRGRACRGIAGNTDDGAKIAGQKGHRTADGESKHWSVHESMTPGRGDAAHVVGAGGGARAQGVEHRRTDIP
jgi:hypothetical protein